MKEQIIKIFEKYEVVASVDYEVISDEIEKIFQQTYLNDCIEKATPNLSKIKDVDKELKEIRGYNNDCQNCGNNNSFPDKYPCDKCDNYDKWEPKTE